MNMHNEILLHLATAAKHPTCFYAFLIMIFHLQDDYIVLPIKDCLSQKVDDISDTYTLAQMAYALALAEDEATLAVVMEKLQEVVKTDGKGFEENKLFDCPRFRFGNLKLEFFYSLCVQKYTEI